MTLRNYFLTLLLTAVICSTLASLLPAVSISHVLVGASREEKWSGTFTVNTQDDKYLIIDEETKAELERTISVTGSGSLRVTSATLTVTPLKEVKWSVGKNKTLTAPGAKLEAVVHWEAAADAADAARGQVSIRFPYKNTVFHAGSYQREGEDWFIREVTVHRSAFGVAVGRWMSGWLFGVPVALLLQSIWLLVVAAKLNKARAQEEAASASAPLPRTFGSKPQAEWQIWGLMMLIFGAVTSLVLFLAAGTGFLSSVIAIVAWCILGAGLFFGLLSVWLVRRQIVTVRVEAEKLAIARGRGEPRWLEAAWKDLKGLRTMQRKRAKEQWLEVTFPNGKVHKLYGTMLLHYPELQTALYAAYEQHRPDNSSPAA